MESRHPQITHESSYNAPFQFLDLGAASGQRRTQQCSLSIHTSLSSRHCRPIAPALGTTSAYTWLKLPVVEDMPRVLAASTLPALLLGGDPQGDPQATYSAWESALTCTTAAGLVVGRALLYPPDGDVASAVDITARLVHPTHTPTGGDR